MSPTRKTTTKTTESTTTNMPDYDPAGKGLDYGGDGEGAGDLHERDAKATEQGFIGQVPDDIDYTVAGVASGDKVAEIAEAEKDDE